MSPLLFIIGLLVFAWACRSYDNRYIAKLGLIALLGATWLGGYALTGSMVWGWVTVSLWFVFPWVEIVGRVRGMRFPLQHHVKHRFPPPRDVFPDLGEITSEVEEAGFEKTDDAGWKWEDTDHFIRLFYHPETRQQAAINVAQQSEFVFSHASLTTRTADGKTYVTTNYPFSFTMKPSPQQIVNRCDNAEIFQDMVDSHTGFLKRSGVTAESVLVQDPESLPTTMEEDLSAQIDHNLDAGVIIRADESHFRYSWRGCFFLWYQIVKDMIRV
jgi:hypothetical protein